MTTSKYYDEDYKPKSPPESGEIVLPSRTVKNFKVTRWVQQEAMVEALDIKGASEIVEKPDCVNWSVVSVDSVHISEMKYRWRRLDTER